MQGSEILLVQDVFDLAGSADGQQQSPGQQGVGVEQGDLGAQGRTAPILPHIGPGEQALKALHGGIHILQKTQTKGFVKTAFANAGHIKSS